MLRQVYEHPALALAPRKSELGKYFAFKILAQRDWFFK
jgi:hypothetical protein